MSLFRASSGSSPANSASSGQKSATDIAALLRGYSIEVMPRTAAAIPDFRAVLPAGTRVYIAHIAGTPISDMVATARRLAEAGFAVMPHMPARIVPDRATLADWIARYRDEAGVDQALLLGGGVTTPAGTFDSAMQMIETGLFDGFRRLHVAGHPEGNRDIDGTTTGADALTMKALKWKQDFANRSDAAVAITTQFCFDAAPLIAWMRAINAAGVTLPVHVGIAGPARLQTMLKFALACGVGPSLQVLQRRARDLRRLLLPHEPAELLAALADHVAQHPDCAFAQIHFFPFGGIAATADWAARQG